MSAAPPTRRPSVATVEACLRLGVLHSSLAPQSVSSFLAEAGNVRAVAAAMAAHHETWRLSMAASVTSEREHVLRELHAETAVSPTMTQAAEASSMTSSRLSAVAPGSVGADGGAGRGGAASAALAAQAARQAEQHEAELEREARRQAFLKAKLARDETMAGEAERRQAVEAHQREAARAGVAAAEEAAAKVREADRKLREKKARERELKKVQMEEAAAETSRLAAQAAFEAEALAAADAEAARKALLRKQRADEQARHASVAEADALRQVSVGVCVPHLL